jgi:protein-S-isoprenylcysteine O-methyltransferase Ste14
MYPAFWLWAIAQALLLPNWLPGRGLGRFWILFFGRVAREERMMLEAFNDSYRAYMARTGRVFSQSSEVPAISH